MLKSSLTLLFVLFFLLTQLSFSKPKRKKSTPHKIIKENITSKKLPIAETVRPTDVPRELFCDSCQAIIKEALKNLRNLSKESDVLYYLTNKVCNQNKYKDYHFSIQEMGIGCETFMAEYFDEIKNLLVERNKKDNEETLIKKMCYEKTEVCNGVDLSKFKPIENELIDGEVYDIEHVEKNYKVYPKIEDYGVDELKKRKEDL